MDKNGIKITARDRVLQSWQKSTELIRDFKAYSQEIEGHNEICKLFDEYAEDEALHASKLFEILHELENSGHDN